MSCNDHHNVYNFDYHTPEEWQYNNEQEIIAAEKQQELTQRLALKADRLVNQTNESVVKKKLETDYHSEVKIKDLEYKCKEIEKQKHDIDEEVGLLLGYQTRIENGKKSLVGDALDVIAECLKLRNCRIGVDLVFDDVEKELLRERELIFGINDELEDLLDKVVLQIRKLRAFAYNLEMDFRNKQNSLKIEKHNVQLNENNIEISVLNNKHTFKPAVISVMEWDRFTLDIISAAKKVLVDGRPIRAFFDKCLTKMFDDLKSQSNAVDKAFKLRIKEYQNVIEKLKHQKIETIKKIEDMQEAITKVKKGIDEKEVYLALVHTRLLNRTRRESVELCRDELEIKLYEEIAELENNVKNLNKTMADSTTCLRHLKQTTIRIDIQLNVKENSLHIDNELCMEQRKRINYSSI